MLKIYFQNEEEFMYCRDVIFQNEKSINIRWAKATDSNNILLMDDTMERKTWIHCLVMVYITCRLKRKIYDIAQSVYYYRDDMSLEQIYYQTIIVLHDNYYVNAIFQNEFSLYKALYTLFTEKLFHVKDIYFDAFLTFNMKSIDDKLIQAVGYGIDEMKLDEAHEQFISDTNKFIVKHTIKTEKVYVIMKDELVLFQENGSVYSQQQLVEVMNKTPLYLLQLDKDEMFLSPLIALSPKEIHLFTERPIEAKVYSLCRIFKGKIHISPLKSFPLLAKVK